MKHLFGKNNGEEHNFWMSYTDLMSGFLIVFIIATIFYQKKQNEVYNVLTKYGYNNVEDVVNMVNDYKARGNLTNINNEFKDLFKDLGIDSVKFDQLERSIRFYPTFEKRNDSILFKTDKAIMMPNLKSRIKILGKPFVQKAIALSDSLPDLEIRIEGHTDTRGSFMHNLELSSDRAYSVYQYIHDSCGLTFEEQRFVEKQMISVGYSYAKPLNHKGEIVPLDSRDVDWDKSRRIEFRIISK